MQYGIRPIQKISVHILLFLFTAGIGNIFYYISVKRKQDQWDRSVNASNTSNNNIYIR